MPLRILVVDDHVDAADSLRIILTMWGYDARTAHSGTEVSGIAGEFRPDVVLLDLGMPGLDGYQVAERLRQTPDLKDVVIVAVTGYGTDEDRRRTERAGFFHHLVKPVEPEEMHAMLEEIRDGPRPEAGTKSLD